jgi:transcriptional regulator with XRE-family HTH domain
MAGVSRSAGLSRNTVSQFISGRTSISYENMLKVCEILDVPIGLIHLPDAVTNRCINGLENALCSLGLTEEVR